MENITVTIFGLNTRHGKELVSLILNEIPNYLSEMGLQCIINPVVYNIDGSQYNMLKASMEDDLVLFDGSIEVDSFGSWDSCYNIATANPCAQDNILVLSRTRLPLNFQVLRTNVPELGVADKDENGNPILSFSNSEIMEWLKNELFSMCNRQEIDGRTFAPRIPVKKEYKYPVPPFEELGKLGGDFYETQERKVRDSLDFIISTRKKGAFISYRSYYFKNKYKGLVSAQDLAKQIKMRHDDPNYPVVVYAEGDIANEFMTEQRIWFVEGFVEQKLRSVEEFWIFETDNEDGFSYYNSWWTQGEIVALMYMKASGVQLPKLFVCTYDAGSNQIITKEKTSDYIPNLTVKNYRELSKYFSNSSGAIDSWWKMHNLRNVNSVKRYMSFCIMRLIYKKLMPSGMLGQLLRTGSYKAFLESMNSHVYDKSFVENRIVMFPQSQQSVSIESFNNPEFIERFMLINSERDDDKDKKEIENRGFISVNPKQMDNIMKNKVFKHGNICLKVRRAEYNKYYWWPIRNGEFTGPNDVIIEQADIWEFVK